MEIPFDKIDIFNRNISSFKETSKDTNGEEMKYMTESEIEVINFDKVKDDYIRDMRLSTTPCSNDALFISRKGSISFIEFKNGRMKKDKVFDVYNKIYDSLLIFNDIVDKNISFCRENVNFILVYNESKNPLESSKEDKGDSSKARIGKYFAFKANKKYVRFDLERFEKIYFREVFTYTEKEFEKYFLSELEEEK